MPDVWPKCVVINFFSTTQGCVSDMSNKHQITNPRGEDCFWEIFGIYRPFSKTLGFLPKGAFKDSLRKGTVLIARNASGKAVGYLLYRIAKGRAAIAHLAVLETSRGIGVAAAMINQLIAQTKHLEGITLRCRQDYDAHSFWPKMGFVSRRTVKGRGADNADLIVWHFDHNHPDLWTGSESEKIRVAIDANVFFDICDVNRTYHRMSSLLQDSWMNDSIELVLTPEIHNDIARSVDSDVQSKSRTEITRFTALRTNSAEVNQYVDEISQLYPQNTSLRDRSDIRHVAHSIAAGIDYLVTRDRGLLEHAPAILQRYGLNLFTPSELICHLDSVEREAEYRPVRLAGSLINRRKCSGEDLSLAVDAFRCQRTERTTDFRALLENHLAIPRGSHLTITRNGSGRQIVLFGWLEKEEEVQILLLRHVSDPLSATLLRQVLMGLLLECEARLSTRFIRLVDAVSSIQVNAALNELGFAKTADGWIKPLLRGFVSSKDAIQFLRECAVTQAMQDLDSLETAIWPGKIEDVDQCYLVPIQAQWAKHFFDSALANNDLFGAHEHLHHGVEAVYYSATKMRMRAPGRILWYVSQGPETLGSMEVKAVSRLREVVQGTAKELFRRFQRLGVFEWPHVWQLAKKSHETKLTAIRFSHTEKLPFPLDSVSLNRLGLPPPYVSPRPISPLLFRNCYNASTIKNMS